MDTCLDLLKSRARDMHRQVKAGDVNSLEKIARLPDFRAEPLGDLADKVQRKHCLSVVSRSLGFPSWTSLVHFLKGVQHQQFGTALYPRGTPAFANIWAASYAEARGIHVEAGGYLLGYREQFFVVQEGFIANLGLDPQAQEWRGIGFDWAMPGNYDMRNRLFRQLID